MDEFRLKVFVTAAKALSFSKCAAALNITQPAVSRHIGELEARFGVPLFSRGSSGVGLTKAGRLLLQHAEGLLSAYQKMDYDMDLLAQAGQYDMDLLAQAGQGRLAIGASTTIAMYLLPEILASFMERSDGIEVSMLSGNSENVEQWLRDGTVDIGFVENASRRPWLHYERLMADELVLVAGTHGRYASLESVTPQELRTLPLVLREKGSGTREILENVLGGCGISPEDLNVVIELSSTEAIKAFVRSSDTLAVVSVIALRRELADGALRIVDIDGVDMPREFATVVRPGEFSGLNERFHHFAVREASLR